MGQRSKVLYKSEKRLRTGDKVQTTEAKIKHNNFKQGTKTQPDKDKSRTKSIIEEEYDTFC